jgi:peptidoglycan/xylan/chitin deacetylase (PgdA/CDA1 family)
VSGALPLIPHLLCRVEGVADRFAITFDDGPSPRHTERILERLGRHRAHATFFQLGRRVQRHPEITRRVRDAGHEVGLHDHHHLPPIFLPRWFRGRELRACEAAVRAAGVEPGRWYRPPFGLMSAAQADEVRGWGYAPVLGDVFPRDPERPGTERIVEWTLASLRAGSILILHDGSGYGDLDRSQTVDAVDRILEHAAGRGLRAVSVGELVGLAPAQDGTNLRYPPPGEMASS